MRILHCFPDPMAKVPTLDRLPGVRSIFAQVLFLTFVLGLCEPGFAKTATTTALAVTSGGSPVTTVAWGAVIKLTATVIAGSTAMTPGTVNFCDATAAHCTDIHIVGTAQLTSSGTAVFKLRPGAGTRSYKAVFVGTKAYAGSSSIAASLTVNAPAGGYPTTTTIAQSQSGYYALEATVSAVSPGPGPTGTVSFLDASDGDAVLATADLGPVSPGWPYSNSYDCSPLDLAGDGLSIEGVAAADFNGDGIPDLAASCVINEGPVYVVEVFLGNGDGTFTQTASLSLPAEEYGGPATNGVVAGDFNGDGILDLAVTEANYTVIYLGKGDGTFTFKASYPYGAASPVSNAIAVSDFNQDGILDLALASGYYGRPLRILLGNGDGTFTLTSTNPSTVGYPVGIAVGDFNGDGIPDLAVTDAGVTILLGNGDGTFSPTSVSPPTEGQPEGIVAADFNGHGTPDLAVTSGISDTLTILLGNGDGTFTPATESPAFGGNYIGAYSIVAADFNGDGIPDLAVGQPYVNPSVLLGNGDGTFTPAANQPSGVVGQILAEADFNGSGIPGLTTNWNGLEVALTEMSATATPPVVYVVGTGTYEAEASYPGNSTFVASASNPITLNERPAPPTLTSPTPGLSTVLGTGTLDFQWTSVPGYTEYQLNLGTLPGASDLYKYKGALTSATVVNLPADGVTVYARLYSYINGVWLYNDYGYAESGTLVPAVLTSPTPGLNTVLGTSNVAFQWTTGTGAEIYELTLSAIAPGASDLYLYKGTATSATVPSLPANGAIVYARLYSDLNRAWLYDDPVYYRDYVYTEGGTPVPAVLQSPTPGLGTVLGASDVTFQWTAGAGVTYYQLNLSAIAPGGDDLYVYKGPALSATAPSLPANGAKVYARLYSYINDAWQYNDYAYTEQ